MYIYIYTHVVYIYTSMYIYIYICTYVSTAAELERARSLFKAQRGPAKAHRKWAVWGV